jgi:hypothetical protein
MTFHSYIQLTDFDNFLIVSLALNEKQTEGVWAQSVENTWTYERRCRKLQYEELFNLYAHYTVIKPRISLTEHIASKQRRRKMHKHFIWKILREGASWETKV